MAVSLSATLEAHAAARNRKPHVRVVASAQRFGFPTLEWRRLWKDSNSAMPTAACVAGDGSLIRVRNVSGTLSIQRITDPAAAAATWTTWTGSFATATSGSQIAVAANGTEVLCIYRRTNTIYFRQSSDYGASFGVETTILTEAAAPSHLTLAFRASTGNVCGFWVVSNTIRRCRRTSGTWAATSTSSALSTATVTGLSAVHDGGDFALLAAGTETSTTHKRVWSVRMGDGNLPTNTWSSLVNVAEADTASTTAFSITSLIYLSTFGYFGTWVATESGAVTYTRAFWGHTAAAASPTSTWSEPAPHEATGSAGAILALGTNVVYACNTSDVWSATLGETEDLTDYLVSARVRFTPGSTEAELVFDDAVGALAAQALLADADDDVVTALRPGHQLDIYPGYRSDGGDPEYGVLWRVLVDKVSTSFPRKGIRTTTVRASGPWEQLDRWASPQVWTTAGSVYTRAALFSRVANRAGIPVSQGSVPYGPSTTWSAYLPSLALAAGETGRSAMRRLLSPVADVAAPDASDGGLRLRSWEDPRWRALMTRLVPLRWWRLHQPVGAVAVFDEIAGALLLARGAGAVTLGIDGPLVDQPTLSARFDGNSALGDSALVVLADNEPWSLVAFVRVNQLPASGGSNRATIAYSGDIDAGADDGYGMAVMPTTGYIGHITEGVTIDSGAAPGVTLDTWHLVIATQSSTTARVYLDGVQVRTFTVTAPTPDVGFSIGAEMNAGAVTIDYELDGDVSEVALFNRALSGDEISALQEARDPAQWTFGPTAHPLLGAEAGDAISSKNWTRVQGEARYADAFDPEEVYRAGARRGTLRLIDANSDAKAAAYAAGALERAQDELAGELRAPWHPGLQLGDVIRIDQPQLGDASLWRIHALEMQFERGAYYDALLALGGL